MKLLLVLVTLALTGCATFPENDLMKSAKTEIYKQQKYALIAQTYINNPNTSIPQFMFWKMDDKIKLRDESIEGCLHNTKVYNKQAQSLVGAAGNEFKNPPILDGGQCLPYCDDARLCYKGIVKPSNGKVTVITVN
jgi:hypothetical protein